MNACGLHADCGWPPTRSLDAREDGMAQPDLDAVAPGRRDTRTGRVVVGLTRPAGRVTDVNNR